jgi:SAM-dependent methyltransferase
MIKTIEYKGSVYPSFQATGNAARFAIPFAQEICIGTGFDIGCGKLEWAFPGAIPIDPVINDYCADFLPDDPDQVDYIFSSHCLEHVPHWVNSLDLWKSRLKPGGTLFLYLPHPTQKRWKPWHNRRHIHSLEPDMIREYLWDNEFQNVFVSDRDLNHSYCAMANTVECHPPLLGSPPESDRER